MSTRTQETRRVRGRVVARAGGAALKRAKGSDPISIPSPMQAYGRRARTPTSLLGAGTRDRSHDGKWLRCEAWLLPWEGALNALSLISSHLISPHLTSIAGVAWPPLLGHLLKQPSRRGCTVRWREGRQASGGACLDTESFALGALADLRVDHLGRGLTRRLASCELPQQPARLARGGEGARALATLQLEQHRRLQTR